MNDDVAKWLATWWAEAGEIAAGPEAQRPENPWKWDGAVYRAATLPDTCDGINIRPLKLFLRGIVALWDPSPINGPSPTARELHALSSDAWATYQTLENARQATKGRGRPANEPQEREDNQRLPADFVDSDYAEPIGKSELAMLLGVSRATIARQIQSGELRVVPGTNPRAKKVRVHADDFPPGLKRPHDRKRALSSGKRQ